MNDDYRYIIDQYNKYQPNLNVIETFELTIGGIKVPYCIRRIPVAAYDWGQPQLEDWIEQNAWESIDYSQQYAYETLEDAREYVRFLKGRNG